MLFDVWLFAFEVLFKDGSNIKKILLAIGVCPWAPLCGFAEQG